MRRHVVRQDQDRRLAAAHEIARDGEHEIGVGPEHFRDVAVDRIGGDIGPAFEEVHRPGLADVVEHVGHLGSEAHRLRDDRRGDTVGRALEEVPDERPADAEAHHGELLHAEMVEQRELIVGV